MGTVLEIKGILIEYVDLCCIPYIWRARAERKRRGLVVAVGFTPADGGEKPHPQTRSCG